MTAGWRVGKGSTRTRARRERLGRDLGRMEDVHGKAIISS
jgi:hypothetical protein